MVPNKFEKHIKKQFKEREIQPSANAWKKINDQLDPTPASNNNSYLQYGIAAGFIGVLFASFLYFNSNKTPASIKEQIVVTPNLDQEERVPENNLEIKIEENKPLVNSETKLNNTIERVVPIDQDEVKKNRPVLVENQSMVPKNEKITSNLPEKLIDVKIAEVLMHVNGLESKDAEITDTEIDSLLRQAQREILEDKIFRKDNTVDAMALLADVEKELDKSFRDEIFDALKEGFIKVRTAVADRNK